MLPGNRKNVALVQRRQKGANPVQFVHKFDVFCLSVLSVVELINYFFVDLLANSPGEARKLYRLDFVLFCRFVFFCLFFVVR